MFTAIFWKKIWSWAKHHWYFPVIIVLMMVLFLSRGSSTKRLFQLMQTRHEQYKQEIDLLNKVATEKKHKTEKALETHKETVERIEKEHDLKIKELEVEKREEVESLIKDHEDNPEELAKELAKILNATHIEAP